MGLASTEVTPVGDSGLDHVLTDITPVPPEDINAPITPPPPPGFSPTDFAGEHALGAHETPPPPPGFSPADFGGDEALGAEAPPPAAGFTETAAPGEPTESGTEPLITPDFFARAGRTKKR